MTGDAPRAYPQRRFVPSADATEVLFVRHGASSPEVPGAPARQLDGQTDPPLAPEGVEQARRVAARLAAGEAIDRLFVTPLRRTAETAAPLAAALGLAPTVVADLREVHLGEWEGQSRARFAAGDPLVMRILADERWDVIPGAETPEAFAARVAAGFDAVVAATGPGRRAVAVVHGGVIGEICRQITASRPFAFIHADNTSVTRVVALPGGRRILRAFNDATHLDGEAA